MKASESSFQEGISEGKLSLREQTPKWLYTLELSRSDFNRR